MESSIPSWPDDLRWFSRTFQQRFYPCMDQLLNGILYRYFQREASVGAISVLDIASFSTCCCSLAEFLYFHSNFDGHLHHFDLFDFLDWLSVSLQNLYGFSFGASCQRFVPDLAAHLSLVPWGSLLPPLGACWCFHWYTPSRYGYVLFFLSSPHYSFLSHPSIFKIQLDASNSFVPKAQSLSLFVYYSSIMVLSCPCLTGNPCRDHELLLLAFALLGWGSWCSKVVGCLFDCCLMTLIYLSILTFCLIWFPNSQI